MHYTTILTGFAFFAVSVCAKTEPLFRNSVRLNRNSVDFRSVGRQHFDKAIIRQRRSLWQSFINSLTSAVEQFHDMKPLLADGVNGANDIGKMVKNKFRVNSKSANVMLSKGSEIGEITVKDKRLKDYAEEVDTLTRMNRNLRTYEQDFINDLEKSAEGNDPKDFEILRETGVHNNKSENILLKIVDDDHKLKRMVVNNIEYLRGNREFIEMLVRGLNSRIKTMMSLPRTEDVHKYLEYAVQTLDEVRLENYEWLKYKTDLEEKFGEIAQITACLGPDPRKINDAEKDVKSRLSDFSESKTKVGDSTVPPVLNEFQQKKKEVADLYDKVREMEEDLFNIVAMKSDNSNIQQMTNIHVYGYKSETTEKTLLEILDKNPEMTTEVVSIIAQIKKLREAIKEVEKYIFVNDLEKGNYDHKLKYIRLENDDWLTHRTDPKLDELINAEYEKFKDKKVELIIAEYKKLKDKKIKENIQKI